MAEFYDADVAEAGIHNKPLKGKWLIDPETGELTDDVGPYAEPIEGYGRVWGCAAAGQIAGGDVETKSSTCVGDNGLRTCEGTVAGTPKYVAPEQYRDNGRCSTPAVDQYAFCVALR